MLSENRPLNNEFTVDRKLEAPCHCPRALVLLMSIRHCPGPLDSVTAVTDGEDRCPRALLQLPAIVCAIHDCVTEVVFSW